MALNLPCGHFVKAWIDRCRKYALQNGTQQALTHQLEMDGCQAAAADLRPELSP